MSFIQKIWLQIVAIYTLIIVAFRQAIEITDSIYSAELKRRNIHMNESGAMSVDYIIGLVIAIFVFFAIFPSAIASFFAVNVSEWKHFDPATGTMVQDTTAITLWNLLPYIIIVFGGIMLFIKHGHKGTV